MTAVGEPTDEALRAREFLKDWAAEGLLDAPRQEQMTRDTVCRVRPANIFLRVVCFFFTVLIAGAAVALFFNVLDLKNKQGVGVLLLLFAALSYAAAELVVAKSGLYHFGVEEGLCACAIAFLCLGINQAFFSRAIYDFVARTESLVSIAGVIASVWIWHRFSLPYMLAAAMIFVRSIPWYWTRSAPAQIMIVEAVYVAGLLVLLALRARERFTSRDRDHSIAEALMWLGICLNINLHRPSFSLLTNNIASRSAGFPTAFYWTTWVVTWCLPAVILARGLRRGDRPIILAGMAAALLALITNKPYFGWPTQSWDPMILGALLIALALYIRHRLSTGPDGIRHGYTARRLSSKDKHWLNTTSTAFGLFAPHAITPHAEPAHPTPFSGGDSGGGGATSDF